jgi:hypothetical protein
MGRRDRTHKSMYMWCARRSSSLAFAFMSSELGSRMRDSWAEELTSGFEPPVYHLSCTGNRPVQEQI